MSFLNRLSLRLNRDTKDPAPSVPERPPSERSHSSFLRRRKQRDWYSNIPLTSPSKQIRVLHIKNPRFRGGQMVCELKVVSLEQRFKYTALSYCWGDLEFDQTITLNGTPFKITTNLLGALKALRSHGFSWIWVDQLCINQENLEEKSCQVGLMHKIYSNATDVAMYLGEEGDNTFTFLKWMNELRAVVMGQKAAATFNDNTFKGEVEPLTQCWQTLGDVSWGAIDVFERNYLYRGWVIQEVALASKANCFIGKHSFDVSIFDPMTADFHSTQRTFPGGDQLAPQTVLSRMEKPPSRSIFDLAAALKTSEVDGNRLMWLLESTAGYELRNPCDRFYSLLGLVDDPETYPKPNYASTEEEVYHEYAIRLLQDNNEIRLLWNADISDRSPSWVPSWHEGRARLQDSLTFDDYTVEEPKVILQENRRILTVTGVRVDTVTIPDLSVEDSEFILDPDAPWGTNLHIWVLSCLAILRRLPSFADERDGVVNDAAGRLIWMGGPNPFDHDFYPPLSDGRHPLQSFLHLISKDMKAKRDFNEVLGTLVAGPHKFALQGVQQLGNKIIDECVGKRKFFTTGNGRYGLGPQNAQDGDLVVRFRGSTFMSIIREADEGCRLIGHVKFPGDVDNEIIFADYQIFEDFNLI